MNFSQALDPDPDGWGPNYDIGVSCNGATLSLYPSRKLGKRVRTHWIFSQLIADVIFEELEDEPRYKALLEQSDAHLAAERKAAEDAGLLPVPEELLASLREE